MASRVGCRRAAEADVRVAAWLGDAWEHGPTTKACNASRAAIRQCNSEARSFSAAVCMHKHWC